MVAGTEDDPGAEPGDAAVIEVTAPEPTVVAPGLDEATRAQPADAVADDADTDALAGRRRAGAIAAAPTAVGPSADDQVDPSGSAARGRRGRDDQPHAGRRRPRRLARRRGRPHPTPAAAGAAAPASGVATPPGVATRPARDEGRRPPP